MKATNSSTNTLFMEIFLELLEIAKAYFQELFKNEKPGVYTLKDIYTYIESCERLEAKQGKAERLTDKEREQAIKYYTKSPYYSNINPTLKNSVLYLCKVSNNIVFIEKDNFKCSFDIIKVFEYLERFKQLSVSKEKLEFVKEGNQIQESEDNCICSFDIAFNKKDKTFLTAKTKNSSYYFDNNILIDTHLSKIYATDAFICKSRNVKISNLFGDWDKHICISFDTFKKLVGEECHIIVNSDDKEEQTVVTIVTDKGEMFECSYYDSGKNVNIESVYPILYKELKLTVKDDKQFTKDLKTISKVSEFVSFEIEKGSDRLRVNYITELGISDTENKYGELFVQLSEPSNFTYRSDNRLNKVLSCLDGWNGEIYFTKEYSYCKLSFVSDNCDNCFMIDSKNDFFNPIRDKNDSFPDKLTPVYCGKETKEPDTDTKPVRTPEIKNDTNLQENKESTANVTEISEKEKEFELLEAGKEYFTGCSLGEVRACLNSKGLSVTIDKDNNIFCVPKGGDSLIREVRVWAYTKLLEINTKVGVHVEKDIDQTVAFSEFLNNCLLSVRQHATNKVFSFLEKEGYHWEQPNTQTFHLFKNGKEKAFKNEFEAYNFVRDKENESYFAFNVSDYTDDMIEVTGLDLESISSKVKQDSSKELKVIQDIKLYDKTGKIVFTYGDGNTNTIIETTFNGDSVLQSVLQKINESM
jgi:hypothetical protein|nr:MAG TPA: hypothetical protein [Caudoviricetes sp.]